MQYALLNAKRLTCHAWSSRTCQKHFSRSVAVFAMGGPKRYKLSEKAVLTLQLGDLTRWEGDAIVNAGECSPKHMSSQALTLLGHQC